MESKKQWDAEWEVSAEIAHRLISSQFPQLASKRLEKLGHGWDNTVFIVEKEYVFRFPRREIAINPLKIEGKLLPKLKDYLSITYPIPIFYGEGDFDYPAPFLGYSYISGTFPIGLTDNQRALSTKTLARFLNKLHAFPVQIAQANGVQQDHRNLTDIKLRKEKMLNFISVIGHHLNEKEYQVIVNYMEQLKTVRVEKKYALLHGDLHFKNMLVDGTGRITGIIDWGDINIGHPACDLNVVYSFLPPTARSEFFTEYGYVDEETKILARLIAVYIPILVMMQAIDDGDEGIVNEAKATIMRALTD